MTRRQEKEAILARNDAGAEAAKRQQEATADVAVKDNVATPEQKKQIEPEQKLTNPVDETVVNDVIAGKYGTGAARVQKLAEAGYDPDEVQAKVNKTVKFQETAAPEKQVKEIVEQKTEQPVENDNVTETKVEEPEVKEPTNLTEALVTQGIPENATADLVESDEGKEVDDVIASGDPTGLQNVVAPDGQGILKGSYDENGNYVPYVYTEADTRLVKDKGWAAALTIISAAMSALGVAAGIPIVPINFFKFGASPQEDLERMNQVEKDYASLMNAGTAEAQEIEKTRAAAQEANISDVDAYKDLSDEDVQKAAQVNASVGGQNTQLDVQREAQEWEAKQAELDREFQKEMNNLSTDSQIAILKQQGINQQDLAELMNDLDVQTVFKKIAMAKEKGLSQDDLAKWIRAEQGTTKLAAAMNYVSDTTNAVANAANAAANIVGTFMPSDKNVKKFVYDGKAANSKMFSSKRKFW